MGLKAGLQILQQAGKAVLKHTDDVVGLGVRKWTKPTNLEGLRFAPDAIGDTINISKTAFKAPTNDRLKLILQEQGLTLKGKFHLKNGSYGGLADDFEETIISDNNLVFIEELIKRFPKNNADVSNTKLQEMLILLRDIDHSRVANKEIFLQEFIAELQKIENLTSKNGQRLFADNVIGIYSKKSILDAKYGNPERYREIMDLFKLHKEGKAPDYLLKTLFPKSRFHELPKSDMQKLLRGEHYYPQLTELAEDVIARFEVGEAFSVGKDMFVKTAKGYEKLKIDAQTYEKLFPPIERYAMAQGPLGNCHLIATMDAMTKNPNGRIKLYEMFEQTPKGVKCTIPGYKGNPIDFSFEDLSMLNIEGYNLNGSLGHRMIEYSYAKNSYMLEHEKVKDLNPKDIIKHFSYRAGEKTIAMHLKNLGDYDMGDISSQILKINPQLKCLYKER